MKSCTCLHSDSATVRACRQASIPTTLRCEDHLGPDDTLALAEEYAVASILYYRHDESFFEDARFDGTCTHLLQVRAWQVVPWLDRESLMAGTGYAATFPTYLHEAAQEWLAGGADA